MKCKTLAIIFVLSLCATIDSQNKHMGFYPIQSV
jgi:hypothetical protein